MTQHHHYNLVFSFYSCARNRQRETEKQTSKASIYLVTPLQMPTVARSDNAGAGSWELGTQPFSTCMQKLKHLCHYLLSTRAALAGSWDWDLIPGPLMYVS